MKPFNKKYVLLARLFRPVWALAGVCAYFCNRKCAAKVRTILLFDFHLIGDIVLLTPLLSAIRARYGQARIALVSGPWASDILQGSALVDELIPFVAPWVKKGSAFRGLRNCLALIWRLRSERWDLGIEVRGDIRQILLLWFSGATRRVGFDFTGGRQLLTDVIPDSGTLAHIGEHHRRIASYLKSWPPFQDYVPFIRLTDAEQHAAAKIESFIGFHFGASLPLRRFPEDEILRLLLRFATDDLPIRVFIPPEGGDNIKKVIMGLPASQKERVVTWSGSLREFVVVASRASHFYLMDSGPAHIVSALRVPVTVFFGPAEFQYVYPLGPNVQIVSKPDVPCRPCDQVACRHSVYQFCMKGLADCIDVDNAVCAK